MESSSSNEILSEFDIECKFKKADLMVLKNSDGGFLSDKCYYDINILGLQYCIEIYPNGYGEGEHRGVAWIFLHVNGSNERKILAEFTLTVESANYTEIINHVYDTYEGYGDTRCKTDEFFESKNKYFVDGEITIKMK